MLTARKLLQSKLHDVEISLRGSLRGFGLKVGPTTSKTYPTRVKALGEGHPTLETIVEGVLKAREFLAAELGIFERRVQSMARDDQRARRLMTTPGVAVIVALTLRPSPRTSGRPTAPPCASSGLATVSGAAADDVTTGRRTATSRSEGGSGRCRNSRATAQLSVSSPAMPRFTTPSTSSPI